jgi:hypothetical protein
MAKSIPLSKFKKFKAEIHMDEAILKSASSMVTELKRDSPNGYRHKKKYRSTWTSTFYPKEHRALVYNNDKINYRLTHLLEHGHVIVNKKGIVGWAEPQPHIYPAFVNVSDEFVKRMNRVPLELIERI